MVGKLKLGNQFRQLLLDTREGLKTSAIFSGGKGAGTLSAKYFCIAILSSSAMFTSLCALPAYAQRTHATDTKQYSPVEIRDLLPEEILPIIAQHSLGDGYDPIEHLRIAESTRISDMMHKYGAGDYSPEEYQALMSRINVGMTNETPTRYDNYEVIGGSSIISPTYHGGYERDILNTVDKYVNYKITSADRSRYESIKNLSENNPNSINIFGNSVYVYLVNEPKKFIQEILKNIKEPCRLKNFLIFAAGTNITDYNYDGIPEKKIYNDEYDADEGWYSLASGANSDKNTDPHNHIMVTIGTNEHGDVDKTSEDSNGSKFPVGFHNKVLFSGHTFPFTDRSDGYVMSEGGDYNTSYNNYVNVAMTALNAQNFADIDDVDELLEMMRSTAGTDYIRYDLNGDGDTNDTVSIAQSDGSYLHQPETVPLQLINPGAVFRKYGMAINETEGKRPSIQIPTEIASGQVSSLEKGWYKGVVFIFPGTEVLVDGEWTPFDNENFNATIKNCNPFHLEFRMNGNLLVQQGFKVGDAIEGTIQAVDDQWGGLKDISKPFTLTMTDNPDAIDTPTTGNVSYKSSWYTISGQKLSKRPTTPGVYIHNGKKVVIQ